MSTTTYMSLTLPTVSVTIGPDWATEINAALETIDSHDHSSGKGAQITPTGMYINSDLSFNSNDGTDLRSSRYTSQSSALATASDLNCVYVVSGNLYYNNNTGVAVQITSGSSIASSGSGAWSVRVPGAYPYTVVSGDAQRVVLVDTSSARTINLPAATTAMYVIIKDANKSSLTNNITVTPNGTDTIDGVNASVSIYEDGAAYGFISDGVSAWYII